MSLRNFFKLLPFGSVPEITPRELHKKLTSGQRHQILDVRTPSEWRTNHIKEAVNVPITSLGAMLEKLGLDADQPTVVICLSAHRSIPAVRLLQEAGFADVCQLKGGMRAWWKDGLPVVE